MKRPLEQGQELLLFRIAFVVEAETEFIEILSDQETSKKTVPQ